MCEPLGCELSKLAVSCQRECVMMNEWTNTLSYCCISDTKMNCDWTCFSVVSRENAAENCGVTLCVKWSEFPGKMLRGSSKILEKSSNFLSPQKEWPLRTVVDVSGMCSTFQSRRTLCSPVESTWIGYVSLFCSSRQHVSSHCLLCRRWEVFLYLLFECFNVIQLLYWLRCFVFTFLLFHDRSLIFRCHELCCMKALLRFNYYHSWFHIFYGQVPPLWNSGVGCTPLSFWNKCCRLKKLLFININYTQGTGLDSCSTHVYFFAFCLIF